MKCDRSLEQRVKYLKGFSSRGVVEHKDQPARGEAEHCSFTKTSYGLDMSWRFA
jgi:hypothetical protein